MQYLATMHRCGVYNGAAGPRDLNDELLQPGLNSISQTWMLIFYSRLPQLLRDFMEDVKAAIEGFHGNAVKDVPFREECSGMFEILVRQVQLHIHLMDPAYDDLHVAMIDLHRQANRAFKPTITTQMKSAYEASIRESSE